jgi:hypothetical protein
MTVWFQRYKHFVVAITVGDTVHQFTCAAVHRPSALKQARDAYPNATAYNVQLGRIEPDPKEPWQ